MTTDLYPNFFNDVFGPIMQAGSSYHFGGPSRWVSSRDISWMRRRLGSR